MSVTWCNRLKLNNTNKNPPNKLFLCKPQKLTYYYNLIGIKNNSGINISKLKLLLTNQFPYQTKNKSLELSCIINKSLNTEFYIYFKFNNIKYDTLNRIPYISHYLVFDLPKLILPKLNTEFNPYSEAEQQIIISKLIKSTSINYDIDEKEYKILLDTFNTKHIEITTGNQCIISYDDYYELYLITLLELRTKHSHLLKSLLNLETASFINGKWQKFNYIQNQNNTKWYSKRRSNRLIKNFTEICQNTKVILFRNLEKHQNINPLISCELLTLNTWTALHQTSIAYISTKFKLIDKVIYAVNLQTDVRSNIKSLEDEFKNLWLTSSDRQRINNLTGIKHAYDSDQITKQDWLMIWKTLTKTNKHISPKDVDILTVWSIGDEIIKLICQNIDELFCLNNADTVIDNLMKQEPSLPIWKTLQTKIYNALNTSSFSQSFEQTNSLCELSHEQRLTCMNEESNDQALSLEQRDVKRWHQGGLCPIESPEGQNIGLIFTLTAYSSIDVNGNILTAYYKIHNGHISNQIIYLSYLERLNYITIIPESKQFGDRITCEQNHKVSLTKLTEAEICYCSDKQFFSPSTNLIPFLKHNDPTRCLMAVNMKKQAVPLLTPQSPLVGTGTEKLITENCHNNIFSKSNGIVTKVDSTKIIIYTTAINRYFVYKLPLNKHNNQNMYIRIRPTVLPLQLVSKGELIAECQSYYHGELSLGANLLVAFMCWKGYNFEDSVLISSDIVSKGTFQSLHVMQVDIELEKNEILTNKIKTIPTKHLTNLQNNGIVKIGCKLHANDVLVGKIKPTIESDNGSDIPNQYALVYKDSSIRLQNDIQSATVIDVRRPDRNKLDDIVDNVVTNLELLRKKYIKHIWHLSRTETIILKSRHQSYGIFEFDSINVKLSNDLQLAYKSYILKFTALYKRCFKSMNLYLTSKS
ncbi:DNA-directed RNA polymerase subunit beta, partial [Candidatus Hodgkinia cicadicola]